jgi:YD repeat-containing protein
MDVTRVTFLALLISRLQGNPMIKQAVINTTRYSGVLPLALLFLLLLPFASWAENVTYTYDVLNRLIRAQYANGTVIQYTYDTAGNRTSRVVSKPNQPLSANTGLNQTVEKGDLISPDSLYEERDAVDLPTGR